MSPYDTKYLEKMVSVLGVGLHPDSGHSFKSFAELDETSRELVTVTVVRLSREEKDGVQ